MNRRSSISSLALASLLSGACFAGAPQLPQASALTGVDANRYLADQIPAVYALLLLRYTAGGIALQSVTPMASQEQCETYMEKLITAGLDPHTLLCVDLSKGKRIFQP